MNSYRVSGIALKWPAILSLLTTLNNPLIDNEYDRASAVDDAMMLRPLRVLTDEMQCGMKHISICQYCRRQRSINENHDLSLIIFENAAGRVMALKTAWLTTERDNLALHEMMTRPGGTRYHAGSAMLT